MGIEVAIARRKERVGNIKAAWLESFGQNAPSSFDLEIGCGKGHFLSAYAAAFPLRTCVGIDLISERIRDSERRARMRSAANAHFFKAEASEFFEAVPGALLDRVFILFPDPWPKKKHHRRRLMQKDFLDMLRAHCKSGSLMYFRTDHGEYFEWARALVEENPAWKIGEATDLPVDEVSQFQRILPKFSTLVTEAI